MLKSQNTILSRSEGKIFCWKNNPFISKDDQKETKESKEKFYCNEEADNERNQSFCLLLMLMVVRAVDVDISVVDVCSFLCVVDVYLSC